MKTDEFAKWAHGAGETLRVDEIEVVTPEAIFGGHGTLRCEDEQFVLKMTLHGSQKLPQVQGTYTREQFWEIRGRIDDKLPFSAEGLAGDRSSHWGHYAVDQATFHFGHLSFSTEQTRTRERELAELVTRESNRDDNKPYSYWGYAYLEGNKPIWKNAGTNTKTVNDFLGDSSHSAHDTFMGKFDDFEFALIRADDDCKAYLRTRDGSTVSETAFISAFASFRHAIAFVQGRETWPQHIQITRGFTTILEDVCPHRELASTQWRLLNQTGCANGADLEQAIVLATKFFLRGDAISKIVQRALYLCRQSSLKVTPLDVGTLSLCAVFEGLVTAIHRHLAGTDPTDEARAFEAAKAELLVLARKREGEGASSFSRLVGLLGAAKPYRPKDALQWLVEHLSLRWEPEMKEVLAAWQTERHALAHGAEPDDSSGDRMTQQSRLAGGINLITARLMGYTGLAIFSALEDRYVRLKDGQSGAE